MSLRKATISLIVVTLAVWIAWDVYAVIVGGIDATESDVVRDASQAFEALAFGGGVVAGHWWINREKPLIPGIARFLVLGAITAAAIAVSLLAHIPTALFLAVGLASGHLLWPLSTNR